jgi:cytochrome c oxidase assembly factor CtaG
VAVTAAAVSPPVDHVTAGHLSAHMIQHVVLIGAAAPLLALAAPGAPRRLGLGALAAAVTALTAAVLAWHTPAAFDAAERHPPLHAVEHLVLLGAATAVWWVAIRGAGPAGWGPGALAVFVASLPMTVLGLGMMLATTPWYAGYPDLGDQQLAGVVMWSGSGLLALVGAIALGVAWIDAVSRDRDPDRPAPRPQPRPPAPAAAGPGTPAT